MHLLPLESLIADSERRSCRNSHQQQVMKEKTWSQGQICNLCGDWRNRRICLNLETGRIVFSVFCTGL